MRRLLALMVLPVAVALIAAGSLYAGWEVNGTCVAPKWETRSVHSITYDGSGGAIIGHLAACLSGYASDVLAAKIDCDGNVMWDNYVSFGMRWHGSLRLVPDGAGGAFAVCIGVLAPTYHAMILGKRVYADGTMLDLAISGWDCFDGPQENPATTTDGANGVIIAWERHNIPTGTLKDICAQRITSGNTALWGTNGTTVREAAGHQTEPRITSDGDGGAIITWMDDGHIYAQRVDMAGTLLWPAAGVPVCTAAGGQDKVQIIEDGTGGAFIVWQDGRGSDLDIYMQRVDANGTLLWVADGIIVCDAAYDQDYPLLISDFGGGGIVAWRDGRDTNYDVYAQRVDSIGVPVWSANGVPVATGPANQRGQRIVPDWLGGAIVSWMVETVDSDGDIYTQRIDENGYPMWGSSGVPVCTAAGDQSTIVMTEDCAGGAVLAWNDFRDSEIYEGEIYAQRILEGLSEAQLPDPAPTLVLFQNYPNPFNPVTMIRFDLPHSVHVELSVYNVKGELIATLVNQQMTEGRKKVAWSGRDNGGRSVSSGIYFYRLVAGEFVQTRKMVLLR